jgi:hypothetical protein
MELSWTMKLRIAAVAAVGVVFVGILAWPWDTPPDPFGALLVKTIGTSGAVTLLIMAFLAGLIAYFVAWPYGRQIGILAVPFGLAVWAVRAGSVAALVQLNPTFEQRQMLFETLRWEPFFWLLVVGVGFVGVTLGQKIRQGYKFEETQEKDKLSSYIYLNTVIALFGSVLVARFCLKIFAQDVILSDNIFSSAAAQPAVGQIVFAVLVSFGLVAFIVKKYLNVSYILPIISSSLVTAYSTMSYIKPNVLDHYVESWPAVFFPDVVISLLPIQIVAFGTIGSIAGYWMAVRYLYWRKHEML